jgi:hypothetical protein
MTPTAWAIAFATRTAVFTLMLHARLVPDTTEYMHGRASWSSPLAAASGAVGGWWGLELFAVASSGALGFLVARRARDAGARAGCLTLALALSPPGFFAAFPSADAAGAAGAVVAQRHTRVWTVALAAACHLEAALVVVAADGAARLGVRRVGAVALGAGLIAMLAQWHLQTRYLLPGAAIVAARGRL